MNDKLQVGFFAFSPFGAAPMLPSPALVKLVTIGGPDTEHDLRNRIEACEAALTDLKRRLAALNGTVKTGESRGD